jgi:hypothetical protein
MTYFGSIKNQISILGYILSRLQFDLANKNYKPNKQFLEYMLHGWRQQKQTRFGFQKVENCDLVFLFFFANLRLGFQRVEN